MKNYRTLILSLLLLGNVAYAEQQITTQALAPVAFESHSISKGFRSWAPWLHAAVLVPLLFAPVGHAPSFMKLSGASIAPVEARARAEVDAQEFLKIHIPDYDFPPLENLSPEEQDMIQKVFALIRQFASEGKGKTAESMARFFKDQNYQVNVFKTNIAKISLHGKSIVKAGDTPDGISFLTPIDDYLPERVMVFGIAPEAFTPELGMARVTTVVAKEVIGRAKSATIGSKDFHEQEASAYDATIDFLNWVLKNKNNLASPLSKRDYELLAQVAVPYEGWWSDYSKGRRPDPAARPTWPKKSATAAAAPTLPPAIQARLNEAMEKSRIPSATLAAETSELRDRFDLLLQLDGLGSADAIVMSHKIIENQLAHPLGLQALMALFVDVSGGENPSLAPSIQFAQRKDEIRYLVMHFLIAFMETLNPSQINPHAHEAGAFWTSSEILDGVAPIARTHQWSEIAAHQDEIVLNLIWVLQHAGTRFSGNMYIMGNEATWALSLFNDPQARDALESAMEAYKIYSHDYHEELTHSMSLADAEAFRAELTKDALNSLKKKAPTTSGLLRSPVKPKERILREAA